MAKKKDLPFAKLIISLIIAAACSGVATGHLNTTFLQEKKAMSETIQTKQCSRCKQFLPISEFYKRLNGLQPICKQCHNQYNKQHQQTHRDKYRQYNRQYYQRHKAERLQAIKRYRQTKTGHLRRVWQAMLYRCNNLKSPVYKNYGARGIKVKFACFEDFYDHIIKELNVDPRGLYIDRINNDGHYEQGNIRFITLSQSNRNKRSIRR